MVNGTIQLIYIIGSAVIDIVHTGQAARFAKPKFADVWTGVYNATHWRDACPQAGLEQAPFGTAQTTSMSEVLVHIVTICLL